MKTKVAVIVCVFALVVTFRPLGYGYQSSPPPFIVINAPTDGTTDAAPLINSTITQSIAATPPVNHFYLPCGVIRVRSAINMTLEQAGITLEGCGRPLNFATLNIGATSEPGPPPFANETDILCDTGNVCIDTAGSQTYQIKNLKLVMNTANFPTPSTVGILTGRVNYGGGGSSNPYCWGQFSEVDNVSILAGHDPTGSHGGYGTVGIANLGAEHYLITHSHVVADFALILDDSNNLYGFTSQVLNTPMQTGCPASTTIITGIEDSFSTATGSGVAVQANDTHDVVFQNLHTKSGQPFRIGGNTSDWYVQGQFESAPITAPLVTFFANTDHFHLQAAVSAWTGSGGIGFLQFGAPGISITNSDLHVSVLNGATQPLIQNTAGTISGGEIDLTTTPNPVNLANVNITGGTIIKASGMQVTLPSGCDCMLLK